MLTRLCRAALLLPFTVGCYTYMPVAPAASPVAGEPVALDITDAGRVGLAERFGPGLTRVEGRLTSPANQEYALSVHKVAFIGQPSSRWSGELVRIDRQYVTSVWQRKLSPESAKRAADRMSLPYQTLLRMWIAERLAKERVG